MEIAFGVVGCLAFIFAVVTYYMQKKEHKLFRDYIESSFRTFESFANVSLQSIVSSKIDFFRQMKSLDSGNEGYWHYKFRFETNNQLGLLVDDASQIMVKVEGVSEDPLKFNNRVSFTYYICKVLKAPESIDLTKGDTIACFFLNGEKYYSKFIGSLSYPDKKTSFIFGSLGGARTSSGGDIKAADIKSYPRLKDTVLKNKAVK